MLVFSRAAVPFSRGGCHARVSPQVLATFVVANASLAQPCVTGDVLNLPLNASLLTRIVSPLLTTFGWLRYATQNLPFSRARYICKVDVGIAAHEPEHHVRVRPVCTCVGTQHATLRAGVEAGAQRYTCRLERMVLAAALTHRRTHGTHAHAHRTMRTFTSLRSYRR